VIGETVGSYTLIQKLGEGGMGEVYLAEHKYIARRTAIKFLLPDLSGSADVVGRFFAEARAASLIEHPGIVEVIDCEIHRNGRAYIVMEHLQGESLGAYLERVGKLEGDQAGALAILRQIASALAAAHRQGIVHRDLKPDNIFLHLPSGRSPAEPIAKVLDFGIAKLLGRSGEGGTKTRTGQLLGTPLYMSPEQCRGARVVDDLSDVYSLGCIMYQAFCGRPPFLAEGFGDLIIAHVSQAPPEPLDLAPEMSSPVRRTMLACLAKDPRDRPESMDRLVALLIEAGAADVIHLRSPVAAGAPVAPFPSSSGARSPIGAGTPRRLAATTPMSGAADTGALTLAKGPVVTPAGIGGTRLLPTGPTTLGEGASQIIETMAPAAKTGRRAAVALSIGAAVVVAIVVARGVGEHPTSTAPASPPEATQATAVQESGVPVPHRGLPATSSIDFTGLPAGASVQVDGQIASLPLVLPRRLDAYRVTVDAEGYQRLELSVDGAMDRTISLEMKKISPAHAQDPAAQTTAVKPHHRSEHRHGSPGFKGFTDL
jgi:eukaryotic-like serine/threonine-protein kinase